MINYQKRRDGDGDGQLGKERGKRKREGAMCSRAHQQSARCLWSALCPPHSKHAHKWMTHKTAGLRVRGLAHRFYHESIDPQIIDIRSQMTPKLRLSRVFDSRLTRICELSGTLHTYILLGTGRSQKKRKKRTHNYQVISETPYPLDILVF